MNGLGQAHLAFKAQINNLMNSLYNYQDGFSKEVLNHLSSLKEKVLFDKIPENLIITILCLHGLSSSNQKFRQYVLDGLLSLQTNLNRDILQFIIVHGLKLELSSQNEVRRQLALDNLLELENKFDKEKIPYQQMRYQLFSILKSDDEECREEAFTNLVRLDSKIVKRDFSKQYRSSIALHQLKNSSLQAPNISSNGNANAEIEKEQLHKILLLGDVGTYKDIFRYYYHSGKIRDPQKSLIGVDFSLKVIENDLISYRLQLWEIPEQERVGYMMRVYLKETNGIFLFFNNQMESTFKAIGKWYQQVLDFVGPIPTILVEMSLNSAKSKITKLQIREMMASVNAVSYYKFDRTNPEPQQLNFSVLRLLDEINCLGPSCSRIDFRKNYLVYFEEVTELRSILFSNKDSLDIIKVIMRPINRHIEYLILLQNDANEDVNGFAVSTLHYIKGVRDKLLYSLPQLLNVEPFHLIKIAWNRWNDCITNKSGVILQVEALITSPDPGRRIKGITVIKEYKGFGSVLEETVTFYDLVSRLFENVPVFINTSNSDASSVTFFQTTVNNLTANCATATPKSPLNT